MTGQTALHLAQVVLAVHFCIAAFVVFGMMAIPLGARSGWAWATAPAWRAGHAVIVLLIAVQKFAGQTCFLSVWEFKLLDAAASGGASPPPLHQLGVAIMHWNMPDWFFGVLYGLVLAYVAVLWFVVPPRFRRADARRATSGRSLSPS